MKNKKEIRKGEIKDKIKNIIDSVNLVAKNIPDEFKSFVNFGLTKDGIYKRIEFAIENIIDICSIINSDLDLGSPETEDTIFDHLENNNILKKSVIDVIREMKRFRNILVHKYGEISDKKAFEEIKDGLKDFDIILKEIENFLVKY